MVGQQKIALPKQSKASTARCHWCLLPATRMADEGQRCLRLQAVLPDSWQAGASCHKLKLPTCVILCQRLVALT